MMATPLPSKASVQEGLDGRTYQQRARWAAMVGRDHSKNPQLKELILEMRKVYLYFLLSLLLFSLFPDSCCLTPLHHQHPPPSVPQYEAEEGFTEMLPGQQKNTAKYYHEEHFALTCAAASKDLGVFEEELQSPSIFFKQLAVREVARLQERFACQLTNIFWSDRTFTNE